jgi:hypothetical protein
VRARVLSLEPSPPSGPPPRPLPSAPADPLALVRAAGVVEEEEEETFIAWIRATRQPKSPAWWRTVAANGDFPDLVGQWRATLPGRPQPAGRCPVHRLEFPCRSCAADALAQPDDGPDEPPGGDEPAPEPADDEAYTAAYAVVAGVDRDEQSDLLSHAHADLVHGGDPAPDHRRIIMRAAEIATRPARSRP